MSWTDNQIVFLEVPAVSGQLLEYHSQRDWRVENAVFSGNMITVDPAAQNGDPHFDAFAVLAATRDLLFSKNTVAVPGLLPALAWYGKRHYRG